MIETKKYKLAEGVTVTNGRFGFSVLRKECSEKCVFAPLARILLEGPLSYDEIASKIIKVFNEGSKEYFVEDGLKQELEMLLCMKFIVEEDV